MQNQHHLIPEEPDYVAAPPQAKDAMYYGLVGEISQVATRGSEVNRVASAANVIALLSAAAGPHHYLQIGDVRHPLSFFLMHVGRSSIAGKGEAMALPDRIRDAVNRMMQSTGVSSEEDNVTVPFLGGCHSGGLSTGEGIARLVHDGIATKELDEAPIWDKRLLISEAELARVMEAIKRQGSTLSPILRDLWDGGSISPATKQAPISATDPHISIRAAITPDELKKYMRGPSATNGLINRFLIYFAERVRDVPFPQRTDPDEIDRLAVKVRDVVKFMLGTYPSEKHKVAITMNSEAEQIYSAAYPELRGRVGSTEVVNSLLERRAPMTCRLAALFALTDLQTIITADHMQAALAWSDYHRNSVEYLFSGDEEDRKKAEKQADMENKILHFLGQQTEWVTRTEITRALNNHSRGPELTAALDSLLLGREIEQETLKKANGIGGTYKRYRLRRREPSAPSHHAANQETIGEVANEANQELQTGPVSHPSHHSHNSSPDADDSNQPSASSGNRQEMEQRAEETLHHQPKPTSPVDHQAIH
ncbi:DUF3987 domain-containing protein [Guyparkeria sp. 1SP6A2]|nr:DUF3987 domain-containing protein [Guyparkeria sp. 1SP6A2]